MEVNGCFAHTEMGGGAMGGRQGVVWNLLFWNYAALSLFEVDFLKFTYKWSAVGFDEIAFFISFLIEDWQH